MIDTSSLPLIDVHCHPFANPGPLSADELVDVLAFAGGGAAFLAEGGLPPGPALEAEIRHLRRDTVYLRALVIELAHFLGCEPRLEAVAELRNAAMRDYAGYTARLFQACGLAGLVVDFGYPQPPVERAAFEQNMPVPVVPVYRIEPLIKALLAEELGWSEFRRRFDDTITQALASGYRGLKSIIAYRSGLDVSPLSRSADHGLHALDAIRRGIGGGAIKKLRDHLLCRALELCIEHDVPMQIHTGMGDYEVNLVACRPALLMDLLRFPAFRACRVLLVHTGYPYHAEAGYMANMLPRVYCDLSEGLPFAGGAARRIVAEVLEMAPISKVLYGSDGYSAPEINFVGALIGKRALAQALADLVEGGLLTQSDAEQAAARILAQNARALYRLEERP